MKLRRIWRSFEKRTRRRYKLEAIMRGADPLSGGGIGVGDGGRRASPTDHPVYRDWETAIARRPRTWYEAEDHGERQPTDQDNWDIPDAELERLAIAFPGMVAIRKT